MDKIKDALTKKVDFMRRHVPSPIFNQLASEFDEFVKSSSELVSIVKKVKIKKLRLKKWPGKEIFPEAVQRERFAQIEKLYLDIVDAIDLSNLSEATRINFDTDKAVLVVGSMEIKIRKFKDTYHALKIVFEDPKKEWFFSEIAEKLDSYKTFDDKKFYNAFGYLKLKIAGTGITDSFILTRQSVKVNPKYLT